MSELSQECRMASDMGLKIAPVYRFIFTTFHRLVKPQSPTGNLHYGKSKSRMSSGT